MVELPEVRLGADYRMGPTNLHAVIETFIVVDVESSETIRTRVTARIPSEKAHQKSPSGAFPRRLSHHPTLCDYVRLGAVAWPSSAVRPRCLDQGRPRGPLLPVIFMTGDR